MVKSKMKEKYIYRLSVDGMMCGMCETHVNDLVRKNLKVNKVKSNRRKKLTIIVSDHPLNESDIQKAFEGSGYKLLKIN